jgi:hypothetical protein
MKPYRLFLFPILLVIACAKADHLPGGSVDADGGVTLSPPSPEVGGRESATPHELGAIEAKLFTPELVMENQTAIGITETQRDQILKELDADQKDLLHLQWELQGEKEKLVKVLDADVVDEKAADAAAAAVMVKENAVKAAHLRMLVRLKNLLTPAQQAKLRELRSSSAKK